VDAGGPFEEIDGADPGTLVLGSRGGQRDPPPLSPGIDLEAAFQDDPAPIPPVSPLMSLDDVLVTAEHEGPPPGSTHQYRIFSVDAVGRRSADACVGSVVRLEKRQPPPQPVGRPGPPPPGAIALSGVRARALQAIDPDLTDADRALLGQSDNAVVLEWGWTQAERDADPHATDIAPEDGAGAMGAMAVAIAIAAAAEVLLDQSDAGKGGMGAVDAGVEHGHGHAGAGEGGCVGADRTHPPGRHGGRLWTDRRDQPGRHDRSRTSRG
jgi:hypothetical protein